ncbi:hypothetical protein FSP39_003891 [Pinctada imbricata]|uniref:Hexosyltransferase n=1 Tax=Pinctada imbricata TaxID=66713 RepID=A0AA89BVZ0_PINIB|nr:hypothetical protein FSP39_003891 [Pinctada imbricata]
MENKATEQTEINPHPYEYIHNPGAICEDESIFIVVLVKSKVDNFEYREAIRYSWGTSFKHLVFLLGASENTSIQNNVTKESQIYNDIVQENFIDDYCNNTLKTIMGFNWAHTYCHSSRYHLFVDDDVFVVKDNLDFLYRPPTPEQTLFIGRLFQNSVPYRDNGSKWYISWEDYPFDRWPPYIAGGAFVTSSRVTQMLHFAFPFVKYLGIDDAYLGIVSKKLGLRLTTWNGFMMNTPKRTHTKLNYRRIVAYHRIDEPQKMYTVWKNYLEFKKELRTPIPFKP